MSDHLTAQQMLRYLDGELTPREKRAANAHLRACWTCRSEVARLDGDVHTVVDAQREAFEPSLAPPPRPWKSWEVLVAGTDDVEARSGRTHLGNSLHPILGWSRPFAIAAVLALIAVGTFVMAPTERVSAKEVLQKIRAADYTQSRISSDRVLRQRIRVIKRNGTQQIARTATLEAWKSTGASYWQFPEDDSAAVELKSEYQSHGFPDGLPLSAVAVDSWARLTGAEPVLLQQSSDFELTFAAAAGGDGGVQRVSVLIEPQTWHVHEMTLQFSEASFEVHEDDFAVMPRSAVPVGLLAELELGSSVPAGASRLTRKPDGPTQPSLESAQLNVLSTLHNLHADLGEPITVAQAPQGVQVSLWQLPPSRRTELQTALAGEPDVSLELSPPRASSTSKRLVPATLPAESDPAKIAIESEPDQAYEHLIKLFGSAEKQREFSSSTLATSTTLLSHCYALHNLQEKYPVSHEHALSPAQQMQLRALAADHVSAIASALDDLERELAPLQGPMLAPPTDPPSESSSQIPWQKQTQLTLETARSIDHLLRAMLTTSQSPESTDSAMPQLTQSMATLRSGLQRMNVARH